MGVGTGGGGGVMGMGGVWGWVLLCVQYACGCACMVGCVGGRMRVAWWEGEGRGGERGDGRGERETRFRV